jgi:hypothetical protein
MDAPSRALTADLAAGWAEAALASLERPYPHLLSHLLNGPGDAAAAPQALHPAFWGSFDWHSSVHMHWTLARCWRRFPVLANGAGPCRATLPGRIAAHFDARLNAACVAAEIAYLDAPGRGSFERTYGWAWLLKLQVELQALAQREAAARQWSDALRPLAERLAQATVDFLPKANYPIRAGTHANSAFGLLFAHEYALACQHPTLRHAVEKAAHAWFGRDRRYPARYEPSGDDFLSPGLLEAVLMQRVVNDGCSLADWWTQFRPSEEDARHWLTPVATTDPSDGKLAHLDGLNLSRAWCLRKLLAVVEPDWRAPFMAAIEAHLDASLERASSGHFAGTHWLASFAVLALDD